MNTYHRTKEAGSHDEHSQDFEAALRKVSPSNDKIEITQQQLSRFLALLLIGSFIIFLSGYTLGKFRTVRHNHGEFMPSLYNIFAETDAGVSLRPRESQPLRREYGHFATFEEADTLCRNLRRHEIHSQIIACSGSTTAGRSIEHYAVCQKTQLEKSVDTTLSEPKMENVKKGVELHD